MTYDFSRNRRIVKTDEFSSVFRLRPVLRSAHFALYAKTTTYPNARLGIAVAKRFAPHAVTRNTVKRVAREIFRQLPLPAQDFVISLSRPINAKTASASSTQLKTNLHLELSHLLSSQIKSAK